MKYTLASIKKTKVYKANIAAVLAIYPGHGEYFAHELMIAANSDSRFLDSSRISSTFNWGRTPQGHDAWYDINKEIRRYEATK